MNSRKLPLRQICCLLLGTAGLGLHPARAQSFDESTVALLKKTLAGGNSIRLSSRLPVATIDPATQAISEKASHKIAIVEMKLAIKDPAVEASASPGDNLAMKLAVRPSANGKGEIAFLEVQNLTELPVTAFAVRSAGPMPESALLLPGTASAGRVGGVGDFTATFMAPRGALVELEGIQVDYVAPALGMDDIAPGKTQRILQFTAPLVKTTRLDTTAILFGDGSSAGDAKIIKEILDARLRTLNSIAAVKPLLATAGLGQTGGKAVQKKTDELLKKKGGPQLSADSHHLIRAIWEQVDQLSAKAAPADTEKLVTSFLADLESKLKRSKPALAQ